MPLALLGSVIANVEPACIETDCTPLVIPKLSLLETIFCVLISPSALYLKRTPKF